MYLSSEQIAASPKNGEEDMWPDLIVVAAQTYSPDQDDDRGLAVNSLGINTLKKQDIYEDLIPVCFLYCLQKRIINNFEFEFRTIIRLKHL